MVVILKVLCDECLKEIIGDKCFQSQAFTMQCGEKAVVLSEIDGECGRVFCSLSCQIIYNDRKARQVANKPHYSKSYRKAKGLPVEFMNEEIGLVREEDCTTEKGMRVVKTEVFWKALEEKIPQPKAIITKKSISRNSRKEKEKE